MDDVAVLIGLDSDVVNAGQYRGMPSVLSWPALKGSVLEALVENVLKQGIKQVYGYFYGGVLAELEEAGREVDGLHLLTSDDMVGTAGGLGLLPESERRRVVIYLPANLLCVPDLSGLVHKHCTLDSSITIFSEERGGGRHDIYVFDHQVLEHIPSFGYWDIKENLIPEMTILGNKVCRTPLSRPAGIFSDVSSYLDAFTHLLDSTGVEDVHSGEIESVSDGVVCRLSDLSGADTVQVSGKVLVHKSAIVSEHARIVGPALIGSNVRVDAHATVINSVLWDGAHVRSEQVVVRSVAQKRRWLKETDMRVKPTGMRSGPTKPWRPPEEDATLTQIYKERNKQYVAVLLVVGAYLYSFWPNIQRLISVWLRSDEFSSGMLVPVLAGYVIWTRRESLKKVVVKPAAFWGVGGLVFGLWLRHFGLEYDYASAEYLSLVVTLWALVLLLAGVRLSVKLASIGLFLLLMLPWPHRVQNAIAIPLQKYATDSAVFCLELAGYDILVEGHVITIGETQVAVAEACNGLRMITAFFVIGALVALLSNRFWWEKVILLVSCLPIALICNTIRLAITAVAFTVLSTERWEQLFHDFGGYAMMPLALGLIVLELVVMERLFVTPSVEEPSVIVRARPR